jgi:DNA-binding MarR family transcriptional regulator
MSKEKQSKPLTEAEYVALAEFRYQVRKFLRHMEEHARDLGQNPQQYQVLLAIEGLPKDMVPSISTLAERMQLNHNSMVELIDRCEERGLIKRARSDSDRRQVELAITNEGYAVLRRLASAARQELRAIGPVLSAAVEHLSKQGKEMASEKKLRKSSQDASDQRSKTS